MAQKTPRIPPHSTEAEESVIGSILIDKDSMIKIADFLEADHFYTTKYATIFQSMMDLYARSEPLDVVSVINRLKEKRQLDAVGGEAAVAYLATVVPTAGNILHYARIVQKNATRRRLISSASDISEMGFNEEEDIDTLMDEAERKLFAVSQGHKNQSFTKIADALEEAFDRIDKLHKGDQALRGVPTGFRGLDNKLAGFQKSDLIILAARPSVGKTALALDFARYAALSGAHVGVFSLEMSKEQLVDRMLAAHARVDLWRLRTGKLEQSGGEFDDFARLGQAMGELSQAPIYIDDHASNNVMGMRTMARRLQTEHGLDLLIIDYLQLMESSKYKDNRVQEVSDISRGLKKLAIELNIPIIALSQLSRAVEMRTDQKPKLSDLRESGCLTGETLITRADTGERVPIKSLAERDDQSPVPVFALDEAYRVVVKPLTKAFSSGVKEIYALVTRSGRVIRASGNHPFRTLTGWRALEDLAVGQSVAVPRVLVPLSASNSIKDDELILLAHLLGDGCILANQPFHYTSADTQNLQIVEETAARLFGIVPRRVAQENWWHVYLPSPYRLARGKRHPISLWFNRLGLLLVRAWEKKVPEAVFSCDAKRISLFLHHLWATDGNISWKKLAGRKPVAAIYYSSTSVELARGVQGLLTRLGILAIVRTVRSPKHRTGYQVHIQGRDAQLSFLKQVGCYGERGVIVPQLIFALEKILSNTNVDVVPAEAWQGIIAAEKERVGMSWRQVHAGIRSAYSGSTIYKSAIGRGRMARLAVTLHSPTLEHLATSDVFWDEIISIIPQGEEEVYDATVPGAHNFVANDVFVHNSIEQDSDVVMFLHRQAWEEGTERPEVLEVDLLIEKHRNGPTGEIPLQFQSRNVTYTETESFISDAMIPVEEPVAVA